MAVPFQGNAVADVSTASFEILVLHYPGLAQDGRLRLSSYAISQRTKHQGKPNNDCSLLEHHTVQYDAIMAFR